nr:lysozyme-like protein 1 isoform X1 [Macaca nemestrina]
MKAAGILTLIGCLVTGAESKIYTRCKLAKIFSRAGLDNYWGFSLGNWICMAYYESGYNTTAQRVLDDGSIDYGIFQINSFTWCRHGKLQENNHCHVACSEMNIEGVVAARFHLGGRRMLRRDRYLEVELTKLKIGLKLILCRLLLFSVGCGRINDSLLFNITLSLFMFDWTELSI